jgi:hypothetical protein
VADIDIQRKEGQPAWVWIAAVVGLLLLAVIIWAVMSNGDDDGDAWMQRDTVPAVRDTFPAARDTMPAAWDTFPAAPDTFPGAPDTFPAAPDTPIGWLDRGHEAVPVYLVLLG